MRGELAISTSKVIGRLLIDEWLVKCVDASKCVCHLETDTGDEIWAVSNNDTVSAANDQSHLIAVKSPSSGCPIGCGKKVEGIVLLN
jgi:hypothetical protein